MGVAGGRGRRRGWRSALETDPGLGRPRPRCWRGPLPRYRWHGSAPAAEGVWRGIGEGDVAKTAALVRLAATCRTAGQVELFSEAADRLPGGTGGARSGTNETLRLGPFLCIENLCRIGLDRESDAKVHAHSGLAGGRAFQPGRRLAWLRSVRFACAYATWRSSVFRRVVGRTTGGGARRITRHARLDPGRQNSATVEGTLDEWVRSEDSRCTRER